MAKRRNYRNRKKYSFRERMDFHTEKFNKAFQRDDKLTKSDSYSAGFINWNSGEQFYGALKSYCDKEAFEAGRLAGCRAYDKATIEYKF